ncbi:MAG: alpha-mannosidase [Anaerolineae bacterium]|nr:alpha-mannosidase [Anaerolineae bacterium]
MAHDLSHFTLYLVGHAHIDLAYRWRWNETVHRIARDTFRGVLRMMEQVPEFTFVQSQLALYEAIRQHYPDLYAQIRQRIAEGRWIVTDGWVEYDHTMPGGESMIRQHLIGSRYAREELGCEVTIAWAPDAFSGHAHTLPTILKGCGIERLLYGRGVPDDTPAFWWEGPDGSRILAYSPVYGYSAGIGARCFEVAEMWREMTGEDEMLFLYGRGDHGGGPRAGDFEALAALRADPTAPRCVHATPQDFFERVLAPKPDLPVYRGELGGGFTGSCSSEGRAKQRNRHMEHLLLTAERFATFAMFLQRKPAYPRVDFQDAWRTVLHHQFHDELPGTSRAPVYRDNDADYDRVQALAEGILDDALAEIAARLDTRGEGVPIVVYNPLAWARSEPVRLTLRLAAQPDQLVVRDVAGQDVPTQTLSVRQDGPYWYADLRFLAHDVPSLGYRTFRAWSTAQPTSAASAVSVSEARDLIILQNADILATIDRHTGHLVSVYDKRAQREVLSAGGYALQVIPETPGESTAWIIALKDEVDVLREPITVEVVDEGPVRASARIAYRYRDSYIVQEIALSEGMPHLEVRLQLAWYERDCCLKAAFPTSIAGGAATFEAPLGAIERPMDGAEVPAQRWIDVSDDRRGASLLNDCRYAFDVAAGCMRMTVVRGIPDLDPEADVGRHDLRCALYPHEGDWRTGDTVRQGWAFNMPLIARQALRRAGVIAPWIGPGVNHAMPPAFGFLQVAPTNIVLSAFKLEEEDWGPGSPLVIRLYETAGQPTVATIAFAAPLMHLEETNHLEEPVESDAARWEGDTATVAFRAHEIKTFRLRLAVPAFAIYAGLAHRDDVPPGELPGFEGG